MKKLIIAILSVIMLLSFASCTKGGNVSDQTSGGNAMSTVESVVSSITGDLTSKASSNNSVNDTSSANS